MCVRRRAGAAGEHVCEEGGCSGGACVRGGGRVQQGIMCVRRRAGAAGELVCEEEGGCSRGACV